MFDLTPLADLEHYPLWRVARPPLQVNHRLMVQRSGWSAELPVGLCSGAADDDNQGRPKRLQRATGVSGGVHRSNVPDAGPKTARAALQATLRFSGFVGAKKRVRDLQLIATDIDWSHGIGLQVIGTGEAILLVSSERPVALDDSAAKEFETLRTRLAA